MVANPTRLQFFTATAVVALPWFWPLIAGPLSAMLPDLAAWTAGALLIGFWPWVRNRFDQIVAWGLLAAALGSAFLGLLQYFDLENGLGVLVVLSKPGEVTANIQQTNLLATLLAVGLLSVWYLLSKRYLISSHAPWMVALLITALAATASRTGMVHLMLLSILVFYWSTQNRVRVLSVLAGTLMLYFVATQALPWLFHLLWGSSLDRNLLARLGADYACASRKVLWANVGYLISLKPWTGWGAGELMFAHYITPYVGERFCMKLSNAHNLPIHLAFVWGVPVALCVTATIGWVFYKLRPWKSTSLQEKFGWGILTLVGFHSLVEFPLWFGLFQVLTGLAVVMVIVGRKKLTASENAALQHASLHPVKFVGIALCSLGALIFIAVDYFKVSQLYLPLQWRPVWYQVDTLNRVRDTVLFKSHVLIAQVVSTPVTPENAQLMLVASQEALHIAPDSRIIRKVIEAAQAVGRPELAAFHSSRYKAAWPALYDEWLEEEKSRSLMAGQ
jgi:O-antigen polymerase